MHTEVHTGVAGRLLGAVKMPKKGAEPSAAQPHHQVLRTWAVHHHDAYREVVASCSPLGGACLSTLVAYHVGRVVATAAGAF
jgi:hypothetical protein